MTRAAKRFSVALLVGTMVVLAIMLRHIGASLLIATLFAMLLWPLQQRLARVFRGRRAPAAIILCAGVVALIVAPVVWLSSVVVREAATGVRFIVETVESEGMVGLVERLPAPLEHGARAIIDRLPREPGQSIERMLTEGFTAQVGAQGGRAAGLLTSAVGWASSLFLQIFLMVVGLYCFLTRGDDFVTWLADATPLGREHTQELLSEFKAVSSSVILSTFVTAVVQAVLAEIGFLIARVPSPLFFGALTLFFAPIPAVGAGGICVAAAALLFLTGHTWFALFLVAWAVLVVGLIDNLLKPIIIRGRAEMSGAVIFFSLLGGLIAFGAVGLIVGPLCIAFFLALLRIYHRDVAAA